MPGNGFRCMNFWLSAVGGFILFSSIVLHLISPYCAAVMGVAEIAMVVTSSSLLSRRAPPAARGKLRPRLHFRCCSLTSRFLTQTVDEVHFSATCLWQQMRTVACKRGHAQRKDAARCDDRVAYRFIERAASASGPSAHRPEMGYSC